MPLFSPSESVYIKSFLSAVDFDSSISPDGSIDPSIADNIPHMQGTEALSKATKDLMSLDVPVSSSEQHRYSSNPQSQNMSSSGPSYWPSIPGSESAHPRDISPSSTASSSLFSSQLHNSQPHAQTPIHGFEHAPSSAGYTLPPISTSNFSNGHDGSLVRPSPIAPSASVPSGFASTPSTKRPLPSSSQPATDPSSSKRFRSSPTSSSPFSPPLPDASDSPPGSASTATGSVVTQPRRSAASSHSKSTPQPSTTSGGGAAAAAAKGTLLSPSQKRANHIQSEQKRRANIRRGYEALCDAVPALREAIRAEEERERTKGRERGLEVIEEAQTNGKGRTRGSIADSGKGKKKKGRAEAEKSDGRAGPRSENVVLQKTIDYITGLLDERCALVQRMNLARGVLPLGHPALSVESRHLDPVSGVPLWEREWNGGMDLDISADLMGADGYGEEDGGSEDES